MSIKSGLIEFKKGHLSKKYNLVRYRYTSNNTDNTNGLILQNFRNGKIIESITTITHVCRDIGIEDNNVNMGISGLDGKQKFKIKGIGKSSIARRNNTRKSEKDIQTLLSHVGGSVISEWFYFRDLHYIDCVLANIIKTETLNRQNAHDDLKNAIQLKQYVSSDKNRTKIIKLLRRDKYSQLPESIRNAVRIKYPKLQEYENDIVLLSNIYVEEAKEALLSISNNTKLTKLTKLNEFTKLVNDLYTIKANSHLNDFEYLRIMLQSIYNMLNEDDDITYLISESEAANGILDVKDTIIIKSLHDFAKDISKLEEWPRGEYQKILLKLSGLNRLRQNRLRQS